MPKQYLKKILPSEEAIKNHKHLQRLGSWLHNPNLWYINRKSVAKAVAIGSFTAFIPIPFQMVVAAILAIASRANVVVSVILVWISNPITIPFLLYLSYQIGSFFIQNSNAVIGTQASLHWSHLISSQLWQPLLLGLFICGLCFAVTNYCLVKLLWRLYIQGKWIQRKAAKRRR